jgi:hypothetical protein
VIDGGAGLGKSTTLTSFGKKYEHRLRRRFPGDLTEAGDEYIPVVYVTLAAGTTVKGLNELIADFFAIPLTNRYTKTDLTLLIQKVAHRCATSLFQIDDIHYLKLNNQSDREVNDHLKHLAGTIPATFIYAGIDCERSGLLTEGEGRQSTFSQTGSRFTLLTMTRFSNRGEDGGSDWTSLLMGIERELCLLKMQPGDLSDGLSDYLFDRTHGEMGALMTLIRVGALRAIETGDERLTVEILENVPLSRDAEAESTRRGVRRPGRTAAKRATRR